MTALGGTVRFGLTTAKVCPGRRFWMTSELPRRTQPVVTAAVGQ
jgi:hypothetical protein